MAEYGAHITVNRDDKPSIFDLAAQETMLETIQPAFKNLLKVLAEKNPSKFSKCFKYADEIFLFIHSLLQMHYLSNYSASFAENFYDLKRIPLKNKDRNEGSFLLRPELVTKSLLALTLAPYIRRRLNEYYQDVEDEANCSASATSLKEKGKYLFLVLWPKIHLLIELTTLVYYLRYLTGKGSAHSPLLHLSRICLARLSELEMEQIEEQASRHNFKNIKSIRDFGWWIIQVLGTGLQNSLEVGAFFLQFLDWFYSSNSSSKLFTSGPIPPPPSMTKLGESLKMDPRKCPICMEERKQETVLSVSGYVFCYSCILLHVRIHGSCPVTNYPATVKQLIRIYHD